MGIWQHIHTVTTTDVSPDLGELAEIKDYVRVEMIPLAIVEALEPFKLHPASMRYICKMFEHLKQMWIGIWQHTYTITTTDVSVEMIPLRHG